MKLSISKICPLSSIIKVSYNKFNDINFCLLIAEYVHVRATILDCFEIMKFRRSVVSLNNSYYNLAEAEYCIGLFMYMCLIGYSASQITILCSYKGQKELIKEIYTKKYIKFKKNNITR